MPPADLKGPDDILEEKEIAIEIQKAINLLPQKCKAVIILYDIEGFSYQEIQEKLNLKGIGGSL